jgi:hypothetical protein
MRLYVCVCVRARDTCWVVWAARHDLRGRIRWRTAGLPQLLTLLEAANRSAHGRCVRLQQHAVCAHMESYAGMAI